MSFSSFSRFCNLIVTNKTCFISLRCRLETFSCRRTFNSLKFPVCSGLLFHGSFLLNILAGCCCGHCIFCGHCRCCGFCGFAGFCGCCAFCGLLSRRWGACVKWNKDLTQIFRTFNFETYLAQRDPLTCGFEIFLFFNP